MNTPDKNIPFPPVPPGSPAEDTKTHQPKKKGSRDDLNSFLKKWGPYFTIPPDRQENTFQQGAKNTSIFIIALGLLPYLCLSGFVLSLFWEFSGQIHLPWRTDPIALNGLLRKITVTGLVGFLTNWIAIKMLFYPRRKRPLLGQGLIPARKERIVLRLGEQISKEIINSKLILEKIAHSGLLQKHRKRLAQSLRAAIRNEEFRRDVFSLVQGYVNQIVRSVQFQTSLRGFIDQIDFEKLGTIEGRLFKLYKLLSGKRNLNSKIEGLVKDLSSHLNQYDSYLGEYLDILPESIEKEDQAIEKNILNLIVFVIEQINVQDVIMENLKRFDEVRLERLLWRSTSDQFLYIQYLGCSLGMLGGFFVWLPYESLAVAALLGISVLGLDILILKLRERA